MIAIDVHLDADAAATMARDVRDGLSAEPKELSPKYFYDERGSQLFEQITELEEYYPTRAEREILAERSAEIVAAAGAPRHAGRARLRLGGEDPPPARARCATPAACATYVPVDISEEITHETAQSLVERVPGARRSAASSATSSTTWSASPSDGGAALIAFLGGTIGNLYPDAAARVPGPDRRPDRPRRPPPARHRPGQGDGAGSRPPTTTPPASPPSSTRTCSRVLNRELGADFDLDAFEHVARYDAARGADGHPPALARRADRPARRARPRRSSSPPARRCAPRSRPSSPASGSRRVYAEAGLEMRGWFTDAGRRLRAQPRAGRRSCVLVGRQRLDQLAELVGGRRSGSGSAG